MWKSVRNGEIVHTSFRNRAQKERVCQVKSFYKAQAKDNFLGVTDPDYVEVRQLFPGFYGKRIDSWDGVAWSGVLLDQHDPCESELPPFSYGDFLVSRNGEGRFTSAAYQVRGATSDVVARYQCDKGSNCLAATCYNPSRVYGCEQKWFRRRGRLSSLKTVACSKPLLERFSKYVVTQTPAVALSGDGITVGSRKTAVNVSVSTEQYERQDVFAPPPRNARSQLHRKPEMVVDKSMSKPTKVYRRARSPTRSAGTEFTFASNAGSSSTGTVRCPPRLLSRLGRTAG
jgi:hypothetical protein